MDRLGLGKGFDDLQDNIKKIRSDISTLNDNIKKESIPELIESTNLLRENEYLRLSDEKKTELLSYYETYSTNLEKIVRTLLEIQDGLKDLLREQIESKNAKKTIKRVKTKKTKKRR